MIGPLRLGGQFGTDPFLVVVGVDALVGEGGVGQQTPPGWRSCSSVGSTRLARLISGRLSASRIGLASSPLSQASTVSSTNPWPRPRPLRPGQPPSVVRVPAHASVASRPSTVSCAKPSPPPRPRRPGQPPPVVRPPPLRLHHPGHPPSVARILPPVAPERPPSVVRIPSLGRGSC